MIYALVNFPIVCPISDDNLPCKEDRLPFSDVSYEEKVADCGMGVDDKLDVRFSIDGAL